MNPDNILIKVIEAYANDHYMGLTGLQFMILSINFTWLIEM